MSIRTYLTLSYVALIALMCFGMWFMADRYLDRLTAQALTISDQAVRQVTTANLELTNRVLTRVGEYVVKDKAEDVADRKSVV